MVFANRVYKVYYSVFTVKVNKVTSEIAMTRQTWQNIFVKLIKVRMEIMLVQSTIDTCPQKFRILVYRVCIGLNMFSACIRTERIVWGSTGDKLVIGNQQV